MRAKPVTFLIVDDDDIDCQAIERTLWDIKISNPVRRARDGVEALDILRGENSQKKLKGPIMVLLDLNMPRMGGLEFLQELEKDNAIEDVRVMVLTTSDTDDDIIGAHKHNIAGYIVKSDLKESLREAFEDLDSHKTIVMAA